MTHNVLAHLCKQAFNSVSDLPVLITAIALLLISLIAGVWDDFPVNDDWVYAHSAKHFAETGVIQINISGPNSLAITGNSAPALVGQVLLGGYFLRITGFKHTYLRALTLAFAVLACWVINRILLMVGVTPLCRVFCLSVLVLNPISAHLAFSFMTEYYGYVFALGGALVWLNGRKTADQAGSSRLISIRSAVISAALIGISFWIRQFCVATFPAVLMAMALIAKRQPRERIRTSIAPVLLSATILSSIVAAYFWWSLRSGNFPAGTGPRMANLTTFVPKALVLMSFCGFAYLTVFLLPLLTALPWRGIRYRPILVAGVMFVGIATAAFCAFNGTTGQILSLKLHSTFPYLSNIIYNAGVGPLTTTDLFLPQVGDHPQWDVRVWIGIEMIVIVAHLLWAAVPTHSQLTNSGQEVFYFGIAFSAISMALIVQACQTEIFDRYLFSVLLGATISMACLLRLTEPVWVRGIAVLIALGLFTTAGVHDYFETNRARWGLVAAAESRGVQHADLEGGWEVNGWFRFESPFDTPVLPVIHACSYAPNCLNDAFVIRASLPQGYTVVDYRRPNYWLAKGPALLLCRRNDIPAMPQAVVESF